MKTNKILMAMVLAAGFTACTSEDVVESTQINALDNRKVLGDIEFVMGEGVDSRFAVENGKWKIEAGDAFGAALVDVPNGEKEEDAYKNYNLTNYIQTNYQYAKGEGDVFTTPARMVEGNYVFYAPYNPNHLSRKPMEVAFPIVQTLDVNEDGEVDPVSTINNALKEGYPFFVDYKFLSAEDQETTLTINFKHLYSYPEVKFVNNSKEDITLDKFVVVAEGEEFPVKPTLNLAGEGNAVASSEVGGIVGHLFNLGTEKTDKNATSTTAVDWGNWVDYNVTGKNNVVLNGSTYDLVNEEGALTSHITIEIPEGLTVAAGEEVVFHIVMPAKTFTNLSVLAMVDSESGYELAEIAETLIPGQRYPKSDFVPSTGKLMAANKIGKAFTKTVKKTTELDESEEFAAKAVAPVSVATTEELITAIRNANETLKVIAGTEVVYNKSVADVLADSKTKVQNLYILGDITFAGTASSVAAEQLIIGTEVTFLGNVTIKSGYVTLSQSVAKEVLVAKDATLTVASTIEKLTNNGTVNAAAGANIKAADNNNIMNIAGEGAEATVNNKKTLNINAKPGTLAITNYWAADATAGTAEKYGTVNVAVDFSTATMKGDWNVTAGTLTLTAAETINKKVTVSAGAKLKGAAVTIAGGATLEVSGTLDADVNFKGQPAVAATDDTEAVALAVAKLDLKNDAKVREAVATTGGNYTSNLMLVGDGVSFSKLSTTIEGVNSRYSYTGNLPDADDKFDVPAVCNTLALTGSIDDEENGFDLSGETQLKYMSISGDIYLNASEKEIKLPEGMTEVTVSGDVEVVAGTLDLNNATLVEISGDLINSGTLKGAKSVEIAGDLEAKESLTIETAYVAKDITVASNKTAYLKEMHVEGNLDVTGLIGSRRVVVYAGSTLTIEADGKIQHLNNGVAFESITNLKYFGDKTDYTGVTLERGKVVNNGNVAGAKQDYKNDSETWWSGNGGVTLYKPAGEPSEPTGE